MTKSCCIKPKNTCFIKKKGTRGGRRHPEQKGWSGAFKALVSWSKRCFSPRFLLLLMRSSLCFLMASRVRTRSWCSSSKAGGSGEESREERAGEGLRGHLLCARVPGEMWPV